MCETSCMNLINDSPLRGLEGGARPVRATAVAVGPEGEWGGDGEGGINWCGDA